MIPAWHRPTKVEVDLSAIRSNIQHIKGHIPQDKKAWAVVKADAYGHGAVAVAKAIVDMVYGFCVSNLDEALQLRQAGLTKPILILGVVFPEHVALARQEDISLAVSSLDWLQLAKEQGYDLSGLKVHLKVDSGMGRIGLRSLEDTQACLAELKEAGARVEGIFTHFATADEADLNQFNQQLNFFSQLVAALPVLPDHIHASNSATTLWHADTIFTGVRLGIAIYGLNPSGQVLDLPYTLKPALRLTSQLVQVKQIEPGSKVGYGGEFEASQPVWIGTLPIGYADGWTRDMKGYTVLVDGQPCPIVGRVSMDQTTILLDEPYPLGTEVLLLGADEGSSPNATAIAQYRSTINYEVLCLLTDRLPRYYKK